MREFVVVAALVLGGLQCRAADLKTGEAVLDRFVESTGGAEAYSKIHSMHMTGSMAMAAMGIKGVVTIYSAEPNKVSLTTDLPGVGKITEGSDGTNAWSYSAMQGPQLKKGQELSDALREAWFHKETDWRSIYKSAELTGVEDVNGKPAYKLVLTPKSGPPETQYYDKDSGLMIRHQSVRKTPFGEIPVDVAITGYRTECTSVKLPHSVVQSVAGQKIELTIDSIECNTEVPAGAFQPPPEVKALIDKQ
jgi:hypothetical protein